MATATTITVTAKVLKNHALVEAGGERWIARPIPTGSAQITRALSALFSTRYEIVKEGTDGPILANVSYEAKRDEILIQVEEEKWRTRSSRFGPAEFDYEGRTYSLHEKITGKFAILLDGEVVASGDCRFRSVVIPTYPPAMEGFLARMAVGLLIRTLFWELGF